MFLWQRVSGDGTKTEYERKRDTILYPFFVVQLAAVGFENLRRFLRHFFRLQGAQHMNETRSSIRAGLQEAGHDREIIGHDILDIARFMEDTR